jgi:hypothetical protein
MHGTHKCKTSVRGSTTALVCANDAAPGLGAVGTSIIIAGGRTRKGARANDDCSGGSKKVSVGDKCAKAGGKARGNKSCNDNAFASAQKGGEVPIDASSSTLKGSKNVQEKKGKRLKTMLAVQEEADEGQFLLSPPTASKKTVAPTPTIAAAAGTLIYLDFYGHTEAPAKALASDKEVDYMPDGNIVISQPSKGSKSAEPEVTQRSKGNDNAVESSDYAMASADYHFETRGSGQSGRTRKPLAKKCKCLFFIQIHLHFFNTIKFNVFGFSPHINLTIYAFNTFKLNVFGRSTSLNLDIFKLNAYGVIQSGQTQIECF